MLLCLATGIAVPLSATENNETKIECISYGDCADNEYCFPLSAFSTKCVAVNCKGDAKAKKHRCLCADGKLYADGKCVAPKCSTDSDCAEKEKCVNPGTDMAACVALNCPPYEKTVDHACVKKPCEEINPFYKTECLPAETGFMTDWGCVLCMKTSSCGTATDCDDAYECRNKQCLVLHCPPCYEAKNHQCIKTGKSGCCATDDDCGRFKKCAGNVCVKKTCAEIYSSYRTICEQTGREAPEKTDTGIDAADGRCFACT